MDREYDPEFEILLDYLKRNRGFDFTGYKRSSLIRRVDRRMSVIGIGSYSNYIDFLEVHPHEFQALFNTILINVTSFFRDADAWEFLKNVILPKVLESNKDDEIRIWSAGCASGEEAFSLAMLLCGALGQEQYHSRVKIYATDVDEESLNQARAATYPLSSFETVPDELRDKYFITNGSHLTFRSELRRSVIFGRHDLVQDAPISRLDLLSCRNTLMYLNAETQGRILGRFHFGLKESGYLFLGKAEMLLSHASLFNLIEPKFRVFAKSVKVNLRDRLLVMAQTGESFAYLSKHARLRELSLEHSLVAQLVVDQDGIVCSANEASRKMFGIGKKDIGKPLQDLEISYRPVELRSIAEQAINERRVIRLDRVAFNSPSRASASLEVEVAPLLQSNADRPLGVSVIFRDVSTTHKLNDSLASAKEELETTNEELQSTNEELETTNEELQSMNEELETTNEELQSINEELETTNEELQSTNEELETTSLELRELTEEVNNSNHFLGSILASMRYAVIVVDKDWNVLVWNERSMEFWGLRQNEVIGEAFFELDIGLPVKKLLNPLRQFVDDGEKFMVLRTDALERRGRPLNLEVRVTPLFGGAGKRDGLVLLFDKAQQNGERTS
jgi:two-component system, chemotaxis family, CheB/CheR fusion protein